MRLSKERVKHMAETLAVRLVQEGHVALLGQHKSLVEALDHVVTDELSEVGEPGRDRAAFFLVHFGFGRNIVFGNGGHLFTQGIEVFGKEFRRA